MKAKQTHDQSPGGGWGSWHQSPVYHPARTCDSQSWATHSIRALVSSRLLLTVRWRPNAPPTHGERTSLIFPPTLRSVSFERTGVDEGRIAGWSGVRRGGVEWGGMEGLLGPAMEKTKRKRKSMLSAGRCCAPLTIPIPIPTSGPTPEKPAMPFVAWSNAGSRTERGFLSPSWRMLVLLSDLLVRARQLLMREVWKAGMWQGEKRKNSVSRFSRSSYMSWKRSLMCKKKCYVHAWRDGEMEILPLADEIEFSTVNNNMLLKYLFWLISTECETLLFHLSILRWILSLLTF